jgi:hypothetical protein
MPRFYFNLSAPDQEFQDTIGAEVIDLAAAHERAVLLADRVMTFSGLADRVPDFRRWTVKITDERKLPVMTVVFPAFFSPRKPAPVNGARMLLLRLETMGRTKARAS